MKLNLSSYLLPYAMLATEDKDAIFEPMADTAIQVMDHPGGFQSMPLYAFY